MRLNAPGGRDDRSQDPRHESVHASASIFLGVVPDEIRIAPLADGESAYITGDCSFTAKPSVAAVIIACGVRDGHGVHGDGEGDLFEFERLVPDPADRERILQLADEVMKTRQFKAVRDALRRRLQFADVMYTDEIAKIATAATGRPVVA